MNQPSLQLNNGQTIPQLGFGTWKLKEQAAYQAVTSALKIGYRHIDTADAYGNHTEVGQAIRDSGVSREEIFLTSKLWHSDLQVDAAQTAIRRILKELQTDYLDLYLIHWPNHVIPIEETLGAMQTMVDEGLIRAYGVSNFTIHHLQDTLAAGFHPVTNQVEFHPSLNQDELKTFCDDNQIAITAYSPIAQGHDLRLPVITNLAKKYDRSAAQVVLNWLIQKNIIAIPRSADRQHIEDNFRTIEWELSPEDVDIIDQLNENYRLVEASFNEFNY
jgi:diketogulonate reductase-like aldo/keto reductase